MGVGEEADVVREARQQKAVRRYNRGSYFYVERCELPRLVTWLTSLKTKDE